MTREEPTLEHDDLANLFRKPMAFAVASFERLRSPDRAQHSIHTRYVISLVVLFRCATLCMLLLAASQQCMLSLSLSSQLLYHSCAPLSEFDRLLEKHATDTGLPVM